MRPTDNEKRQRTLSAEVLREAETALRQAAAACSGVRLSPVQAEALVLRLDDLAAQASERLEVRRPDGLVARSVDRSFSLPVRRRLLPDEWAPDRSDEF
jgi:hypothetical protein